MPRPQTSDHASCGTIDAAALWLLETPRESIPGSVVCELRSRFGLNAAGAVAAIAEAQRLRNEGGADG